MGVFYKEVSPCQMKNRDPCTCKIKFVSLGKFNNLASQSETSLDQKCGYSFRHSVNHMRQHCFLTSLSIVCAHEFWHYQGPIGSRSMARRNFECFYMILIYLVDTTELWVSGNIVMSLLASLTPQPARQRFRRL